MGTDTSTVVALLDEIRAHLAAHDPAPVWSVHVDPGGREDIRVQLAVLGDDPARVARDLVAWANTLSEVSALAWRVSDGKFVHLVVNGRLPGGATIQVYDGIRFAVDRLGGSLKRGGTIPVTLAALRRTGAAS